MTLHDILIEAVADAQSWIGANGQADLDAVCTALTAKAPPCFSPDREAIRRSLNELVRAGELETTTTGKGTLAWRRP